MNNTETKNTVHLAEHLVFSTSFKTLFAEGMGLVEETANYLDGDGRQDAKLLSKPAAALYSGESMRLTTRLMQLASWLLLQRSVNEGSMTREQLVVEKKKIKLEQMSPRFEQEYYAELPDDFKALVERSVSLSNRIRSIDEEVYGEKTSAQLRNNPVFSQLDVLAAAFSDN